MRAAGGVIVDGDGRVLVAHRPRYDDWSLPKGKADPGESDEDCAVREVEEETGWRCRLVRELPSVRYYDRYGRPKIVRYWEMAIEGGEFRANDEVDEVAWLDVAEARRRLSYDRDASVLDALGELGKTAP